jgi:hypothetical protein
MLFMVTPAGRLTNAEGLLSGPVDASLVTVILYVDGVPATTGEGTETVTIPLGDVALSADAADVSASELPIAASVAIIPALAMRRR